ncbi:AHH domain-containing protein [Caproiciproducens sp. CPB-2]|uniref:AHH domain-containing protein n=1 Tax=Caproiciproducens sp. CPB-2 TaxID=3030017 RepID=UPI0023DAAA66|nr:AHH domain-containing protein [Caproiciproducens sp. CPB-2]MDF1494827.1 hypothetical protein [Caproiciproducens sp. CPB-2]
MGESMSGTISWASSQANSIAKSISDSFARTKIRPKYRNNYEVHHIVAKAAPNAAYAARILREVLPRGVEDSANKLLIKTGLHRRIHTNTYYGWANSVVISAYNAANGNIARQRTNVYGALTTIRSYVLSLDAVSPY